MIISIWLKVHCLIYCYLNWFHWFKKNISNFVKKGPTQTVLPQEAEESRHPTNTDGQLLKVHHQGILSSCITVWSACKAPERKDLQRVVRVAERIIGTEFPDLDSIYISRMRKKAISILRDPTQPCFPLFQRLPSGRQFHAIKARTSRLRNSFFPRAVSLHPPSPTNPTAPIQFKHSRTLK